MLESFDPGWSARVDGILTPALAADDVFLAAEVPAGTHEVRFHYATPGAAAGAIASLVSLVLLAAFLAHSTRAASDALDR